MVAFDDDFFRWTVALGTVGVIIYFVFTLAGC